MLYICIHNHVLLCNIFLRARHIYEPYKWIVLNSTMIFYLLITGFVVIALWVIQIIHSPTTIEGSLFPNLTIKRVHSKIWHLQLGKLVQSQGQNLEHFPQSSSYSHTGQATVEQHHWSIQTPAAKASTSMAQVCKSYCVRMK